LTPNGRKIRHEGVEPDLTIGLSSEAIPLTPTTAKQLTEEQIRQTEDEQVQEAYRALGLKLNGKPSTATPTK
jgi:C-terminal processing protease CtpA/Prc